MMSKTRQKRKSTLRVTESSGNVFADLGLANPEQELLKARLTLQIYRAIKDRKLTQVQAGEVLGIQQPHVSKLMRGQSGVFSVERLMDFLTALGHDIRIAVTPSRKEHGKLMVSIAESTTRPAI
jgi:predicted XRE-type DNA-binding protein